MTDAEAEALADDLSLTGDDRELVAGLLRLGVSEEQIRRASQRGRIGDAIFEGVLDPERAQRTISAREVEAGGGLSVAETAEVLRAFGLPAPEPEDPYFTPVEAEVFIQLGRMSELWPADVRLEISRIYGDALSRIARTEVQLFRSRVEPRLREISPSPLDALAAVRQALGSLLPLIDPMLFGVHRRKLEQELTQATLWEVELHAEGLVPGSTEVSLLFCDLKDFTAYVNSHGDAAAIAVVERFAQAVDEHHGDIGRVVKALGDGYLLAFPGPSAAVAAALRIAAAMREQPEVAVHAGVHHGVAVHRDGDYFGRAVNLAARLVAAAPGGELLATEDVATGTPEYAWRHRGSQTLRGFEDPLEIYALDLAAISVEQAGAGLDLG